MHYRKHGCATASGPTRLYKIWGDMKYRCNNANYGDFAHYGGRGIKVCETWEKSFEAFQTWSLKNGYDETLTIDRVDVNGDYEPTNCRWVSRQDQNRNRRNNKKVECVETGTKLWSWEVCDKYGMNQMALYKSIQTGYRCKGFHWKYEEATT